MDILEIEKIMIEVQEAEDALVNEYVVVCELEIARDQAGAA